MTCCFYTYKVVNTYPHDRNAFTQGLYFEDGILYEGTGLRGRSTLRKVQLETGEIFVGFYLGGQLNKGKNFTVLESLPQSGTCELMCHPGGYDPEDRYGHWGYRHEDELAALTDPSVREWIERHNVQLTTFSKLANQSST